jgi:hypothetical protein
MTTKARLVKKGVVQTPVPQPKPKPATKPVRPEPKRPVNPRAAFDALFAKKESK